MTENGITYIGTTNYRNNNKRFGIRDADRMAHIYMLGKSGVGKTTLIQNMVLTDIARGNGCMLIDPHGDMSRHLIEMFPNNRKSDLVYMDAHNSTQPIPFNPLHGIAAKHHHLVASGLISSFRKIWSDSWGVRLEYLLKNAILTLLWYPQATLLDIQPLLTDTEFRTKVLHYVLDERVSDFWHNEFNKYSPRLKTEAISPILNKVGVFAMSFPLRAIVGVKNDTIRLSQIMDNKKILLVNLSKGAIGEDAAALLGSMLISTVANAAMHRVHKPENERVPFYLYIDECHSFITEAIAGIFAEARKYKLSLCIANQYLSQLSEPIRKAIFGNVGSLISFRVGSEDAQTLSNEFYPEFDAKDLISLPKYSIYLKLMIDGATSQPFSAITLPADTV